MTKFIEKPTAITPNRELQSDEYFNETDHLIYCSKCNTPRQCKHELQGKVLIPSIRCKCQQEIFEQEEAQRKLHEKQMEIEHLKTSGLQDKSLYDYTFAKDNGSNPEMKLAHNYANKKVAVMARSVIMTMFDLQCEYVEYNTNSEILKAVENGEVDYGICHEAVAEKIIEKENLSVVPSLTIMNSFLTFGVWEDKEELRDQMNTILKYYANQGTLARLENKWIVNYSRNRSLSYVIEQNKVFYVAYLITWLFVMFLLSILKVLHFIGLFCKYRILFAMSGQSKAFLLKKTIFAKNQKNGLFS